MNLNLKLVRKNSNYWIILLLLFAFACSEESKTPAIPETSEQMVLVLTDSITATSGFLYYFARENAKSDWKQFDDPIEVVIGRGGLGWGIGLHNLSNSSSFPNKVEGDGRSPAGIFKLSSVFGYNSPDLMTELKMPYFHITEMSECIDDATSKYYNQIVSRDSIEESDSIDWTSSEKMRSVGIYYELGVVVNHNSNSIKKGYGSCIFLHNWANSNETMAGCTAMTPEKMHEIAFWLDDSKNPVLVQLTEQLYLGLKKQWKLPETTNNDF
jgi:L,D-transpeptidase-like protein